MIIKIEMYGCKCDNCGKQWGDETIAYTDEASMRSVIEFEHEYGEGCGWVFVDGKDYCSDCWKYDDNGFIVFINLK